MTEFEFKKALNYMTNDERHRCKELAKGLKDTGWSWERARECAVAQIWGMK